MKTINKFLATAIDYYPYNLELAIEALDYALSYDDKCTMTLCLYGRLMSEQLQRYEEAKSYFEQALAIDINAVEVYPHFIKTLIKNEDFEHAQKLCEFASSVKGIDRFALCLSKIELLEKTRSFKQAGELIREAKLQHSSSCHLGKVEDAEKRIKLKRKLLKEKPTPKKGKKSKKKAARS